jgi:hypothetical protein
MVQNRLCMRGRGKGGVEEGKVGKELMSAELE